VQGATAQKRKSGASAKRSAAPVALAPLTGLNAYPSEATLDGSYSFQTILAVGKAQDGSERDLTETATLTSSNPSVVRIGADKIAYPVHDGTAEVTVSAGGRAAKVKFLVKNTKTNANLAFETAITPILVKNGCAGSGCHGAPNGRGGLKLSFFGYESEKDWEAIVKANGGRRIHASDPAKSSFILKPAGVVGHGGGKRFAPDGPEARVFTAWIKAGAPFKPKAAQTAGQERGTQLAGLKPEPKAVVPTIDSIFVTPGARLIRQADSRHQLVVTAKMSDGSERDVTPFARYNCDDDGIAVVSSAGKLTALRRGEANIMVRYAGKVGLSSIMVQPQKPIENYPNAPRNNFIDDHVFSKLKALNIIPSDLCDDATFIRRVYFDIAGTPPLPGAVRTFIEDTDPQKRVKLIHELLERPEFRDYQTILWADLLRNTETLLKTEGVKAYTNFIRDSFAENKPFDQFVRELLTGSGSTYKNESAAANYYRVTNDPTELTTSTSQIFLGVRLDCARCHNHPFDRWTMNDFYGMSAFFAKTHQRGGLDRDEIIVYTDDRGEVRHIMTNQVVTPKYLTEANALTDASGDLRVKLAAWLTAKENPFFAKATVNRIWKQFFGRGIVHPADDFRATNPPINAPLLDALARDFVENGFDIKHLIRTICTSRTYQLSSKTNATNADDTKNFSHYYIKRLGPQQLLDAIVVATGVEEPYPGQPLGKKAINLADNSVPSYFLDVFGRSRRLQVAEPSQQTSMSQALAMMNGPTINNKITDANGRVAQLVARLGDRTPKAILTEIYLATLARYPTEAEIKQTEAYLKTIPTAKEGYEDLMWSLLNTKEFLFNH
jgi:hypothetical protein